MSYCGLVNVRISASDKDLPVQCKVCQKTLPNKREYKDHMNVEHKNEAKVCEVKSCQLSVPLDRYEAHMYENHFCTVCDKLFKDLTVHNSQPVWDISITHHYSR